MSQLLQQLLRPRANHPAAGVNQRLFGCLQQLAGVLNFQLVPLKGRLVAGQVNLARNGRFAKAIRHILGYVNQHRARTAGSRQIKGFLNHLRQVVHIRHQIAVFNNRPGDTGYINFLKSGNPDLKNEEGWSYDAGVSFDAGCDDHDGNARAVAVGGSVTWFDSHIDDWIIWLPTTKGFFSPRNVKKVHAYGIEVKSNVVMRPADGWIIGLNGSYSWTPSINEGDKMSPADMSVGKQLPYVPKHSASVTGRLSWNTWGFLYKWAYYSERFTMSSNDYTLTGHLPDYYMSNISLEKGLSFKPVDIQLKLAVNNLFNEDYMSVLSRPMPGINFEFFIGITPKFGRRK